MTSPARVRRVTADLVGIGGRIRTVPEDFLVEEVPLYEPAGRGDHVMFLLEKKGISTFEALLWVSKAVKVSEHSIGYAGLKDALAVTRQWMSVAKVPPERVLAIDHPRLRVLEAAPHAARMRIGHLRGNRFTIRVRGADVSRIDAARAALERLTARGVPNAYGVQRFGVKQDGHEMGRAILRGDFKEFLSHLLGRPHSDEGDPRVREARESYDRGRLEEARARFPMKHRIQKQALSTLLRTGNAEAAYFSLGKRARKIYVSAYQSYLFNRCLDVRIADGTYDRLLSGDLAWLHESGALYAVADGASEVLRAGRFEASASGPLPGYDMRRPLGRPLEIEESVLRDEGIDEEAFRAPAARTRGGRRPYRVPLTDASIEPAGGADVVLKFTLPPGSFATIVLDEVMKTGAPPPDLAPSGVDGARGAEGADDGEAENLEEASDVPEGA